MWNPYRNKLTLSNARGGWTPLFNLFAFPGRMYTVFCLQRPRAEPNEDEMIELYRVSPYNFLEDSIHVSKNGSTSKYQWTPQFSFYACESAFPGTVSLTVQERVGATGDVSMRISMSSYAHDSIELLTSRKKRPWNGMSLNNFLLGHCLFAERLKFIAKSPNPHCGIA